MNAHLTDALDPKLDRKRPAAGAGPTPKRGGTSKRALARIAGGLGVVILGSLRCTGPLDPQPLQRFETCDALQVFLEDQILHPGVEQSFGTSGPIVGCAANEALVDVGAPPRAGEGEGEGGRQFTTTNTQETAVDEPDFVKNDGDKIFVLRRGEMIILSAWPANDMEILSRTPIAGTPFTMLFDTNSERALVLSTLFASRQQLMAKLFDVSDPTDPIELRTVLIDGEFTDARAVGNEVMLVTNSFLNVDDSNLDRSAFSDDANRARLRQQGLAALLPKVSDFIVGDDDAPRVDRAVACENTYAPARTDGRSILMVHGLSMTDERAPLKSTGVVAGFSHVYGSTTALYLASTERADGGYFTPSFTTTRVHKLNAFSGTGAAEYRATGVFSGQIKDELSLDEGPDGTLRMVITDNSASQDFAEQVTALLVIEESGTDLLEVARVDDLGRGEQVESVRFIGDKAYIVTYPIESDIFFDQNGMPSFRIPFTDPLFVVDLADPRAPRLRAELEVGGYSAYIHPLDDDMLLTVGVNTDPDNNDFLGLKLMIFDVSNPDDPLPLHEHFFGGSESSSEALFERHAFTYFAAERALALPLQTFNPTTGFVEESALAVFRVDVGGEGFVPLGTIEQRGLLETTFGDPNNDNGVSISSGGPCASVRRSVMISDDDEGAFVYAISTAGITAASLEAELPTVATVRIANDGDLACDPQGGSL